MKKKGEHVVHPVAAGLADDLVLRAGVPSGWRKTGEHSVLDVEHEVLWVFPAPLLLGVLLAAAARAAHRYGVPKTGRRSSPVARLPLHPARTCSPSLEKLADRIDGLTMMSDLLNLSGAGSGVGRG